MCCIWICAPIDECSERDAALDLCEQFSTQLQELRSSTAAELRDSHDAVQLMRGSVRAARRQLSKTRRDREETMVYYICICVLLFSSLRIPASSLENFIEYLPFPSNDQVRLQSEADEMRAADHERTELMIEVRFHFYITRLCPHMRMLFDFIVPVTANTLVDISLVPGDINRARKTRGA
jgi:hypothetical protein